MLSPALQLVRTKARLMQTQSEFEAVEVMRGKATGPVSGPLPGVRLGQVVAYEFELAPFFEPWPGRSLLERTFVLLDLGVSFSNPPWARYVLPDGTVVSRESDGSDTWYVDLISVEQQANRFTFRDMHIDVKVPMDGRHQRLLDLNDFADAIDTKSLNLREATDALRRWQMFLDRHLHSSSAPTRGWTDFPPEAIRPMLELPPFKLVDSDNNDL
jgi:hypothetical protein